MIASHIVFGCYGFWLPNDPRGSWSTYVRNRQLLPFGLPTTVNTTRSVAHRHHNTKTRLAAKKSLTYPPVILNNAQVCAVARGFAKTVDASQYKVYACVIMPDHVHIVVANHSHPPRQIMGHLKGKATLQLFDGGLHPFATETKPPSPWAQGGWVVYLDTDHEVDSAIKYVENNPLREGKPIQTWDFVESC